MHHAKLPGHVRSSLPAAATDCAIPLSRSHEQCSSFTTPFSCAAATCTPSSASLIDASAVISSGMSPRHTMAAESVSYTWSTVAESVVLVVADSVAVVVVLAAAAADSAAAVAAVP